MLAEVRTQETPGSSGGMLSVFRQTLAGFFLHGATRMAAAIAYYALFSLPPLLVIAVTIAGLVAQATNLADDGQVRELIHAEVETAIGQGSAEQVDQMIELASTAPKSTLGLVIGAGFFLFGASGVMFQLQAALNEVWSVRRDPARSGVKTFLLKRLLSFGMVLCVGFLLLLLMFASIGMSLLGNGVGRLFPEPISAGAIFAIGNLVNLVGAFLLFAAIFKWLADVVVHWRDALAGAALTAVLFILGKSALAVFFARVDIGSMYGAAGSLALILFWIYYSALIFLFGAEFTRALTLRRREKITPQSGAVVYERVVRTVT